MPFFMYFLIAFGLPLLIVATACILKVRSYRKTEYYRQTRVSEFKILRDKGRSGEFSVYTALARLKGYKKFLFNCYVPKSDDETTEIDVIMLHTSGIYVIESKNYSGWIFGTDTNRYWTQTLPLGRGRSQKTKFYNPVYQNKTHIKCLKKYLGGDMPAVYSYIVFSDGGTLKDVSVTDSGHRVINRRELLACVRNNASEIMSAEKIDEIYDKLYPLTQVGEAVKSKHVVDIEDKLSVLAGKENVEPSACETAEVICPLCGGKLVERTVAKGVRMGEKFLGCSNFPKCRFSRSIRENDSTETLTI